MRIAGTGCCLLDILYPLIDFASPAFTACRSLRDGDGGLSPGRLVFDTDLGGFLGRPCGDAISDIAGAAGPGAENIGGPSIVALIHAAQMLEGKGASVSYHGPRGEDEAGSRLAGLLSRTPVALDSYIGVGGPCPATLVLSDPRWDSGRGERSFVNILGAAARYGPEMIGEGFFDADIAAFGGTALTPLLHEALPRLLSKARGRGALTLVNTVFDFHAERRDPSGPWPLGGLSHLELHRRQAGPGPMASYEFCELLIMDLEECLRLAGSRDLKAALGFLRGSGLGAFLVTRGAKSVIAWAGGPRFAALDTTELPVADRRSTMKGDTTGCGDNFAGGVIASLAEQLMAGRDGSLDLAEAGSWGIAAGAFTLGFLGGTWIESRPGEKRGLVEALRREPRAQAARP